MEHDGCKLCKYEKCSMESKECMGCKQNAVDKYTRMTQADRIRSMSDEELAEIIGILAESNEDCAKCPAVSDKFLCKTCKEGILEWLQSEVEE